MASKKKKSKPGAIKIGFQKIFTIWKSLPTDAWFEILNKFAAANNWHDKSKGDIWGQCIYHPEDSASFHINPEQGLAYCFGCNQHVSDPIRVIAKISKQTYTEAFSYIYNQYGPLPGFTAKSIEHIEDYAALQEVKILASRLLNAELVDAAVSYLSGELAPKYEYAEKCLKYLKNRNVPLDLLHALPIGIVPPPGNLYEKIKALEKNSPEARIGHAVQTYLESIIPKGSSADKSNFEGWLLFVNHITPNTMGVFRIRDPSSEGSKNILAIKDNEPENSPIGYFGLGTSIFQPILGRETPQAKTVVVVEGEFDALAAIIPQVLSGDVVFPVVSAGGNTNINLDALSASGFDTVHYVPDWDNAGNTVFQSKLKATEKLNFKIFRAPDSFKHLGKDLHDSYIALGGEAVVQEVSNLSNYIYPHEWALIRVEEEAESIPEGDVKTKAQVVHNYIKLLRDQTEKELFIRNVAKLLNLDEEILKRYASPDTDEGFIESVCNYLETIYEFVYQENVQRGKRVVAWNKETQAFVFFDLASMSSVLAVLRLDLGAVIDWIEHKVGTPPECQSFVDEDGVTITKSRDKKHKHYITVLENDVIPRLLQRKEIRMRSDMTCVGQGVHMPDEERIYVVNGNKVFKGLIQGDIVTWAELMVPQDEEYLFEIDGLKQWSTGLKDLASLTTKIDFTLAEVMNNYQNVFDTGFRFVNHDLECQYLASFLLAAPMIDIFDHVPWIFINGPTSSGKSSLNQVLASQEVNKRVVTINEHAISVDNATPAGVKQVMKGTTLALMLDEFEVGPETSHESKHLRCREILELVRGSMGRGAKIAMGSQSGNPVYWTLRFPFVASGIYTFHKQEDINRFNIIEMAIKDPLVSKIKVSSPKFLILQKYSVEEIKKLREVATLLLLQNVVGIKKAYEEIKKEFSSGQYTDADTHARFREQLLPIFTMQKLTGKDYKTFANQYTKCKSRRSVELTYQYKYDEIWQLLFHTSALTLPTEEQSRQTYTLSQVIENVHKRAYLNMLNSGVYYLQEEELLAVVWTTALNGPLLKHTKFMSYGGPEKIRNLMMQDSRVIDDKSRPNNRGLLQKLSGLVGRITWKDVTFIPIKEFLSDQHLVPNSADNILEVSTGIKNLKSAKLETISLSGNDNI